MIASVSRVFLASDDSGRIANDDRAFWDIRQHDRMRTDLGPCAYKNAPKNGGGRTDVNSVTDDWAVEVRPSVANGDAVSDRYIGPKADRGVDHQPVTVVEAKPRTNLDLPREFDAENPFDDQTVWQPHE